VARSPGRVEPAGLERSGTLSGGRGGSTGAGGHTAVDVRDRALDRLINSAMNEAMPDEFMVDL
jgi:hypothetical protein